METRRYSGLGDIDVNDFRRIWNECIIPSLKDNPDLRNARGGKYIIDKVDENQITRFATSNKRKRSVSFQECQKVYNALIENGEYISSNDVRNTVELWCAAFIISLLDILPHVKATNKPRGLELIFE
ncbi:MAG: hypothetical protein K2I87_06315 [Bacteroidales bacterium]|nr:hypothetical protein [Bacteroidales bacterium]